jgi:hypothetical protein
MNWKVCESKIEELAQYFPEESEKIFKSSVRITRSWAETGTDDQPNMEQNYHVIDNGFRFVPFFFFMP